MQTRSAERRTAFTLIELLVVITIIAVLASMLLPAIAMVREAAGKTSCAGRMRQVGMIMQTYASEHEDILSPPMVAGGDTPAEWSFPNTVVYCMGVLLGQYDEIISSQGNRYFGGATPKGRDSVFHCPRDPRRNPGAYNISYGMNVEIIPIVNGAPAGQDPWIYAARRVNQFRQPSELVISADSYDARFDPGWGSIPPCLMLSTSVAINGGGNWGLGVANSYYDWVNWHRNGANLLYLDGHVRTSANPTADCASKVAWFTPPP